MNNAIITTEGVYTEGVVIPRIRPGGRRVAVVTLFPPAGPIISKSDEDIWKELEPVARRIRKDLFKKTYPKLHEKKRKGADKSIR